jgi:hypothetical protein
MAKHNCAICGAEVNLFQQQKLADGNYICRKICAKRVMKGFDFIPATLNEVQAHIKQVEDGTRIYQQLFVPRKKEKDKSKKLKWLDSYIAVAEDIGLIARIEIRYKIFIFGKSVLASVYRLADLYGYEHEEAFEVVAGNVAAGQKTNTTKKVHYIHYYFWDTPGVADFRVKLLAGNSHAKREKYFNELFGIQKTLGNIGNTWKNQMAAIKAVGGALKSAVSGGDDANAKAEEARQAMDRAQYGDRTKWAAKADKALRGL